MRDLGAARLSRKKDASTSIERQREQITLTSRLHEGELIHITEDTDVSGKVSPFEREGLGPWLTDPDKIDSWDCLIIPKLDRLTRSLRDFDDMVGWLKNHGKTLISVSESLDLSNPNGRFAATMLAEFAQFERERMAERRKERWDDDKARGWYGGGPFNYGLRPVKKNDHWELEVDPETYARLEDIAYKLIEGQSATSIANHLNALEVPPPRRGKWHHNTIIAMFRHDKCPLDADLLVRVTDALDKVKTPYTKREDASMLLNIAHCGCGAQLYAKRHIAKGRLYQYYSCAAKCGASRIPMALLDDLVDDHMILEFGNCPLWRKKVTSGKSYHTQIGMIERQLRSLAVDGDMQEIADLRAERDRLVDLERRQPENTEYEPTDMKLSDYWPHLAKDAKRLLLLEAGIAVLGAKRQGTTDVSAIVQQPEGELRFIATV
jgi:DNA invertase Pin-like site-specific DNA recombinase